MNINYAFIALSLVNISCQASWVSALKPNFLKSQSELDADEFERVARSNFQKIIESHQNKIQDLRNATQRARKSIDDNIQKANKVNPNRLDLLSQLLESNEDASDQIVKYTGQISDLEDSVRRAQKDFESSLPGFKENIRSESDEQNRRAKIDSAHKELDANARERLNSQSIYDAVAKRYKQVNQVAAKERKILSDNNSPKVPDEIVRVP